MWKANFSFFSYAASKHPKPFQKCHAKKMLTLKLQAQKMPEANTCKKWRNELKPATNTTYILDTFFPLVALFMLRKIMRGM